MVFVKGLLSVVVTRYHCYNAFCINADLSDVLMSKAFFRVEGVFKGETTGEIRLFVRECTLDSLDAVCPELTVTDQTRLLNIESIAGVVNVQHNCKSEGCRAAGRGWAHQGHTRYSLNVFCTAATCIDDLVPSAPPMNLEMEMSAAFERMRLQKLSGKNKKDDMAKKRLKKTGSKQNKRTKKKPSRRNSKKPPTSNVEDSDIDLGSDAT